MSIDSQHPHSSIESRVAEKYRQQGFEVIVEPEAKDLPFDLGTYQPDLVARKSEQEGYIIEIKRSAARIPVQRYQEIAEIVSEHAGWRFLLITGEDTVAGIEEEFGGEFPGWKQLAQRKEEAGRLVSLGQLAGAFLLFWVLLEALMRKRAEEASLPLQRLPTPSLIKHLYSQGELSMEQFDRALTLQGLRNALVHGIEIPDIGEPLDQLQALVSELLKSWAPA